MRNDFGIRPDTQEAFTFGDCWKLARSVNTMGNLKMAALVCKHQIEKSDDSLDWDWQHIGNLSENGQNFIDVAGVQSLSAVVNEWVGEFYSNHSMFCEDEQAAGSCLTVKEITAQQWEKMVIDQDEMYPEECPDYAATEVISGYVKHLIDS